MKLGIALAAYQPPIGFFVEQLRSLQAQTYSDWVCVINLDSPLEPLRSQAALDPYFSDPRFIWSENPQRLGHKKNFEKAIQIALVQPGVKAIACSDQDDVWYPEKLARSVELLKRSGPLSLVHTDMHYLTREGITLKDSVWTIELRGIDQTRTEHLLVRNVVAGCSMVFDAELARRFPVIPDGAIYHDHWYALVASFYGGVHPVRQALFAYRQHGANEVGVTPFIGTFTLPSDVRRRDILTKCRRGWMKTYNLASSAIEHGLPLGFWKRATFQRSWDGGLLMLFFGLRHIFLDPPLARACFARGVGKAAFWIGAENKI